MSGKKAEHERIREAYLQMAKVATYRPQAPSDGMGNIELDDEELQDQKRLEDEETKYADNFIKTEDAGGDFNIGITDFKTNRGVVYAIEAAKALCGANRPLARKLLEMALEDVKTAQLE